MRPVWGARFRADHGPAVHPVKYAAPGPLSLERRTRRGRLVLPITLVSAAGCVLLKFGHLPCKVQKLFMASRYGTVMPSSEARAQFQPVRKGRSHVTRSIQPIKAIVRQQFHVCTLFAAVCLPVLLMAATPSEASARQLLSGHVPQAVASSRVLSELPRSTRLNLAIGLPLRNQKELDALLAQLSDPASPNFRHYLSPDQFTSRFGPTEQDYQSLIAFAHENGLVVTGTHPNRVLLDVAGDVSDIEKVFHVKMLVYRHPVRGDFYAPDSEPSIDADTRILSISGLDNFSVPQPMNLKRAEVGEVAPDVTGSGPGGYFIGNDFRAAYAPGVTLTGSGQVVGLLEFDGFYAGDEQKNAAQAGLPVVPTQTVLLDGFNGAPGGGNIEVILDIMMASYMAPGLSKVIVYEGEIPNDVLNRMATDNLAKQLSSSWGFGINATTEQIYEQFIAQGQSMTQASGDSGAYENGVMTPSDDPNLTVVGGTSLTTSAPGGAWQSESAWSDSGGGVSTTYPIPSYQQSISMKTNGGSTTMRNIPDVALTADIQMFLIQSNGQACVVGGTSAAAPLWAGFIALANQQAATNSQPPIGFLNPPLYSIGEGSNYATDLHDITQGSNGGFSAVTGYDLTTGWGSPAGQHLINDLSGTAAVTFILSSSVSALSIKPAGTGSATITVTAKNGFNGSVSLSATGLPSGVTAVFSPATTTSTSTVAFTVSTAALAGTYPITITGVSGTLSCIATIGLTVAAPGFSLSASVASLSVPRGANGSSTISVSRLNGFTGSVALSATGLPTGVTAVFSPATATTTSTLSFNASSTANTGTSTVTVTGTSGTLKNTITIGLTVTAPSFTLTFQPGNLALPRGCAAAGTLTMTALGGFKGVVTLTASGLPSGVTATFGALNASGVGPVTFKAASTVAVSSFPITISGVSGSLKANASFTLTVPATTAGTSLLNLSPAYNINALVMDGIPFTGGGLDGGLNGSSTAYSANLVGVQQTIGGTAFYFGPANALDAVSGKTVALPAGQFAGLKVLATGVNGNQLSQVFKVTYTDGTVSTFTQSLSDWFTPQSFPGEAIAMTMPYRDNAAGQIDYRTFYLYEYIFALNASKTVASVTLPNNRNVVALAATLTTASASAR
jgi:pro-kumamolisin-like protein